MIRTSVSDFRSNFRNFIRRVRDYDEVIVLLRHGTEEAVVMSPRQARASLQKPAETDTKQEEEEPTLYAFMDEDEEKDPLDLSF